MVTSASPAPQPEDAAGGLQVLLSTVTSHRPDANLELINRAYEVARDAHAGQTRRSGAPYIEHPVAVATIVAELGLDENTIAAALMHDVLEDTEVTEDQIRKEFGDEVVELVEGVTKLQRNTRPELSERQRAAAETARAAESLRKMLLAMAQDMRVMIIKLADRLHNMRTIDSLPPAKQTRIATETHDIYGPLAARLGIWQVKWQLEDLVFKTLHPKEFQDISDLVAKTRRERESDVEEAKAILRSRLEERGLSNAQIMGRPKHLYSIFNKLRKQGVSFEEIYDLTALRILVDETHECYVALGIVHDLWLPMPGLFYDYIAMPKPNGYQSLHTKVMGPKGEPIEIQIRTKTMHQIAEFGVAAHWAYKEGSARANQDAKLSKLRQQLFDWSSDTRLSSDFLRTVSTDLFSEQVFVFTPKGDVIDLPTESTPIDFAFRVHTDLGLTVVGARVNGHMVPLSTKLQNGDVIELISRSNAQPSLDWLEFVQSAHARNKLRHYFRRRNKSENAARGKDAIERELRSLGLEVKQYLGEDKLQSVAETISDCETGQDVLAQVGEGLRSVQSVVTKLRGLVKEDGDPELFRVRPAKKTDETLSGNIDNVMYRRAKCCMPLPGDEAVGYVARGRGIIVHRKVCPNALQLEEREPERMKPFKLLDDGQQYPITLNIVCVNRQGLLMDISTIFAESKLNVAEARIKTLPNHTAEINITIDVANRKTLVQVMNRIGAYTDVISVLRLFGRQSGGERKK